MRVEGGAAEIRLCRLEASAGQAATKCSASSKGARQSLQLGSPGAERQLRLQNLEQSSSRPAQPRSKRILKFDILVRLELPMVVSQCWAGFPIWKTALACYMEVVVSFKNFEV